MQTWLSANEIAAFVAPGLPTSANRVLMLSRDAGWPHRQRAGSRTKEFALDALPLEAQVFIRNRQLAAEASVLAGVPLLAHAPEAAPVVAPAEVPNDVTATIRAARAKLEAAERDAKIQRRAAARVALGTKSEKAQSKGYARAEILDSCDAWLRARCDEALAAGVKPLALLQGQHLFCAEYNAGRVAVHPATRERVQTVSVATLGRWREKLKGDGLGGLADNRGGRAGSAKIDQEEKMQAIIVRQAINNLHVRAPLVRAELCSQVKPGGLLEHLFKPGMTRMQSDAQIPSESAILRWLRKLNDKDGNVLDAIKDPDGHRGRRKSAFGNASEKITGFGQLWELDSTPGDVLLDDGKRYCVIGVIDIWSRNAKLLVVPTAKAVALGAMFRKTLLDPHWGVPAAIRIDNGSDYVSHHMRDLYRDLEIEAWICPPGSPWKKPHIERFFRTFAHSLVEFLPGFIGHNVAERKQIESRAAAERRTAHKRTEMAKDAARKLAHHGGDIQVRMNPEQFQKFCDQWLSMYHHQPHSGLEGLTPFQKRASWSGELTRVPERALDVLLMEGDMRMVGKEGITFGRNTYAAPELDARWRGKRVRIKYDSADAGFLYVFHPDAADGFICKALCPELVGVPRAELAAQLAAADRRYYSDGKRRLKTVAKQAGDESSHERILGMYEEIDSKLTLWRQSTVELATPMLGAAAAALVGEPEPVPPPAITPAETQRVERMLSRDLPGEDLFDWSRALALEEKLAAGELPELERIELDRLRRSPGYEFVTEYFDGSRANREAI